MKGANYLGKHNGIVKIICLSLGHIIFLMLIVDVIDSSVTIFDSYCLHTAATKTYDNDIYRRYVELQSKEGN